MYNDRLGYTLKNFIFMCKKLIEEEIQRLNFNYGNAWKKNPELYLLNLERNKTVRYCDHCGREMNESDVNDFGSLCESCYNEEYYD